MTELTEPLEKEKAGSDLQAKFALLEERLNAELFEREAVVHGAVLALISRQHMFQVGPPGVAKTYAIERLFAYIDGAKTFRMDISRFTTDRHVFGPEDLRALRDEGRLVRVLRGRLADADLALLDEFWNGRSVLNTLHKALNQRRYEQDGEEVPIPLSSAFLTSNQVPEDPQYDAVYDRVALRYNVAPLKARANRHAMLAAKAQGTVAEHPPAVVTWAEVKLAQQLARTVHVPEHVIAALDQMAVRLKELSVHVSDRRLGAAVPVVQAEAWLAGRSTAQLCDAEVFAAVAWTDPEDIGKVQEVVFALTNPAWEKVQLLQSSVELLAEDLQKLTAPIEPFALVQLKEKSKEASRALQGLISEIEEQAKQGDKNMMSPRVNQAVEQVRKTLLWVFQELRDLDRAREDRAKEGGRDK